MVSSKERNQKTESNFAVQGIILAAGVFLAGIIGIVYRIPMINRIGDEAMGYYGIVFQAYSIVLLLCSGGLPLAVSKLVSDRLKRRQYRNAKRVLRGAFFCAALTGGIAAAVIWFGADFFAKEVFFMPYAASALRALAPAVWITAYLGVVRGFFQGQGTAVPTAFSLVLEQFVNAAVSVWAGTYFFREAQKLEILKDQVGIGLSSEQGAAGGSLGAMAGAFAGLLALSLLFWIHGGEARRRLRRDRSDFREGYGEIAGLLFCMGMPVILSVVICHISSLADCGILAFHFKSLGQEENFAALWGIYTGKYRLLIALPLVASAALSAALIPALSRAAAERDWRTARNRMAPAIRLSMRIAIPFSAGLMILSGPISESLFSGDNSLAVKMTLCGASAAVFGSFCMMTNAVLLGIGRTRTIIRHGLISLAVHLIALVIMTFGLRIGIFSAVYADMLSVLCMGVLNRRSIRRILRFRQEFKRTFLIPCFAAAIMGGAALGFYQMLLNAFKGERTAVLCSVLAAAVLYSCLILKLDSQLFRKRKKVAGRRSFFAEKEK